MDAPRVLLTPDTRRSLLRDRLASALVPLTLVLGSLACAPHGSGDDEIGNEESTTDTGTDTGTETGTDTGTETGTDTGTETETGEPDPVCGDGILQEGEECDDGNNEANDGCSPECENPDITDFGLGHEHTCVVLNEEEVHCWGRNDNGQLGLGYTGNVGDDEPIAEVDTLVDLGNDPDNPVINLTAGYYNTCALLGDGNIKCWGNNGLGGLGIPGVDLIGNDDVPADFNPIDIFPPAVEAMHISSGEVHNCAVSENGDPCCWGDNFSYQLGHPGMAVGDNEAPFTTCDQLVVGFSFTEATSGGRYHTVALSSQGELRAWGYGASGALGYGDIQNIGDNEVPATKGNVPLDAMVFDVVAGDNMTCALILTNQRNKMVVCFGEHIAGSLGIGNAVAYPYGSKIGDNEPASAAIPVELGGEPIDVEMYAAGTNVCALVEDDNPAPGGDLVCWGSGFNGQLGHGNQDSIGDDETPGSVGRVQLPGPVMNFGLGGYHACAEVKTENNATELYCWGGNDEGQLGLGHQENIGDDEPVYYPNNPDNSPGLVELF